MAEIRKAHELLAAASRFRLPQAAAWLLPLHSSVSAEQQRRVFQVILGPADPRVPLLMKLLPTVQLQNHPGVGMLRIHFCPVRAEQC